MWPLVYLRSLVLNPCRVLAGLDLSMYHHKIVPTKECSCVLTIYYLYLLRSSTSFPSPRRAAISSSTPGLDVDGIVCLPTRVRVSFNGTLVREEVFEGPPVFLVLKVASESTDDSSEVRAKGGN